MANNKAFKVKNGLELEAYSKAISDTAVDIFVYDTRKDSDGGAWRKRTQHTSWYNETLNTSTRGSRKEFPAVAVIVCRTNTLTIYDGDDPDLPMWMVFNTVGSANTSMAFLGGTTDVISSCSISNGTLVITIGNVSIFNGIRIASFISEEMKHVTTGGYRTSTDISERNTQKDYGNLSLTGSGIVNNVVNDVAMTVLPNAPIDAATGLPVPTIAVATDGGVSVIKDDGTVVDVLTSSGQISEVSYNQDDYLWVTGGGGVAWRNWLFETNPTSDGQSPDFTFDSGSTPTRFGSNGGYSINKQDQLAETVAFGKTNTNYGPAVHLLYDTKMVAFIDPSYNTGWMNGDIKLATLSDTDATNVTGAELVTNGTFDTDVSGWSAVDGTIAYSSGQALVTRTGGSGNVAYQDITTVVGSVYVLSGTTISTGTGDKVDLRAFDGSTMLANAAGIDNQTVQSSATFTATSTTTRIWAVVDNSGTATIDNISVRLAEEDRSVNGNGLQVFGTVTKSAVATGADLVAYSGFSSSSPYNSLQQPYNADLNFTGDFCTMVWVYFNDTSTGTRLFFDRAGDWPTSVPRFFFGIDSSDYLYYYTQDSGGTSTGNTAKVLPSGVWSHCCFVRRGTNHEIYLNGNLQASQTKSIRNLTQTDATLTIGNAFGFGNPFDGSLSLARISATAPSPEQIKKIYEDEKFLFQEGAQATLYGSSDAVTALAYDDSTELLHVGTSAGRSVFQGLRRVDNTTTAVGAAISASNGLVADE